MEDAVESVVAQKNVASTISNEITTNTTNSERDRLDSSQKKYVICSDEKMRGTSKSSIKRNGPSASICGINLLKFPPGFFGDD